MVSALRGPRGHTNSNFIQHSPHPDVFLEVIPPCLRCLDDYYSSWKETLPQLDQPTSWLVQTIQEIKHDHVKAFNFIRDPGHLCMWNDNKGWVFYGCTLDRPYIMLNPARLTASLKRAR